MRFAGGLRTAFLLGLLGTAALIVGPAKAWAGPVVGSRASRAADFVGSYDTNWGSVVFRLDDGRLEGSYDGPFHGRLIGAIDGARFRYEWVQTNGAHGHGYFEVSASGVLSGAWGRGESETNGGPWFGRRM